VSVFSFGDSSSKDESEQQLDTRSGSTGIPAGQLSGSDIPSDDPVHGSSDNGDAPESFDDIIAKEFGTSPGNSSHVIAKQLYEASAKLDLLKAELNPKIDRIKSISKEMHDIREAAQKALQALNEELIDLKSERETLEWDKNQLDKEVIELKRTLQLELEKERASATFQKNLLRFDELTAGLKWREFAFEHQLDGGKIMANNHRTILADKMGLGKTLTSIIACDMAQSQRILVVCPSDVCDNFAEEFQNWSPHRMVFNIYKQPKPIRDAYISSCKHLTSFVIVINYEAWRKDEELIDELNLLRFDTMILDEAHTIKNIKTDAFKGIKKIAHHENTCPKCGAPDEQRKIENTNRWYWGCIRCDWDSRDSSFNYALIDRYGVKNIFPMTGTPILNKPQELYSLLHLLMPDIFTTERVFLDLYCVQNMYSNYWEFRPGALNRLSQHLAGKYIARTKDMVGLDIPEADPIYHEIPFDVDGFPNQWRIIQQLSKHAQIILDSGKKMTVLATIEMILRKRQANVWPGGIQLKDADGNVVFSVGDEVKESMKVNWVFDKIVDTEGERCVVFSQFKPGLHELKTKLEAKGIPTVIMDGDTSRAMRDVIRIDFDRKHCDQPGYEKKFQVVLCNYKTGGVGLNLTGATSMFIMDEEWNPGKNEQAWARIARIGQTGKPQIHVVRIDRTIDTWMAQLNEFKKSVVGGMDTTGQELTSSLLDAMKNGDIV